MLLLSGIGDGEQLRRHGIETVVELKGVGQNLQDHLHSMVKWDCAQPVSLYNNVKPLASMKSLAHTCCSRAARARRRGSRPWPSSNPRRKWPIPICNITSSGCSITTMAARSCRVTASCPISTCRARKAAARSACARPIRWRIRQSSRII
ncbi:MAG: hypothetical protein WDN69_02170 [Aliidongia sp.]